MAPRRGGGSSSSDGGSAPTCPDAFLTVNQRVGFANDVLFFAVFLGISIAICMLRKRTGPGKKLVGISFIASVLCQLITYGCSIVATVLRECDATSFYTFYYWQIATSIFSLLSTWLLLFVVVYTLNTMLRAQLGHTAAIYKIVLLAVVGIMGALTCAMVGLSSYINWSQTGAGSYSSYSELPFDEYARLQAAYYSLYLVSVLASGVLALMSIMSFRSRKSPAGDLIGWVIALIFAMVLWVIIALVISAWYLQSVNYTFVAVAALSYISNFGLAMSYIFILCIAKHAAWSNPTTAHLMASTDAYAGVVPQQQYGHNGYNGYNGQPNGQVYHYQQAPVYNGSELPTKP